MAAKSTSKDQYPNIAYLTVTRGGAVAPDFARLDVMSGALISGDRKLGLVIHKVQYDIDMVAGAMLNANGYARAALCISPNITRLGLDMPEVLDFVTLRQNPDWVVLAASNAVTELKAYPIEHEFSTIGGILVPADRLYLAIEGDIGLATGYVVEARLWYTTIELSTSDYWELIESRRIIST